MAPGCRWSETSSDTILSVFSGMVDRDQPPVGFFENFQGEREDRGMKPPEIVKRVHANNGELRWGFPVGMSREARTLFTDSRGPPCQHLAAALRADIE